jgi:RNA recognition motif-containing protein
MNIYVGNLSYNATEEDLKAAFGAFGAVTTSSIIKDKFSGESRGFGFVEMPSNEEGQKAIDALNGQDLKGRALNVNEAKPRTEGGGGGRSGGGRPGGKGGFGGGRPGGSRGGFGGGGGGGGRPGGNRGGDRY